MIQFSSRSMITTLVFFLALSVSACATMDDGNPNEKQTEDPRRAALIDLMTRNGARNGNATTTVERALAQKGYEGNLVLWTESGLGASVFASRSWRPQAMKVAEIAEDGTLTPRDDLCLEGSFAALGIRTQLTIERMWLFPDHAMELSEPGTEGLVLSYAGVDQQSQMTGPSRLRVEATPEHPEANTGALLAFHGLRFSAQTVSQTLVEVRTADTCEVATSR